jgi:hypothetical protein
MGNRPQARLLSERSIEAGIASEGEAPRVRRARSVTINARNRRSAGCSHAGCSIGGNMTRASGSAPIGNGRGFRRVSRCHGTQPRRLAGAAARRSRISAALRSTPSIASTLRSRARTGLG